MDIYKHKKYYEKLVNQLNERYVGKNKEIITKYIAWHNFLIEKETLAYGSALKSLQVAKRLADYIPNLETITETQLEKYWTYQQTRPQEHKDGSENIKDTNKKLGYGGLQKINSQTIKLVKFIDFLKTGRDTILFNSKKWPVPEIARFINMPEQSKKTKEPLRVSQEDVKRLIDAFNDGTYTGGLMATLVALLNDTGLRIGEALTLQNQDITIEEDYLIIKIRESKTATRTVISVLAKPYIMNWLAQSKTRNNPNGLFFSPEKGKQIYHGFIRNNFNNKLKKLNIPWPHYKSVHYLRHIFASRCYDWPEALKSYWLGWAMRTRMLNTYSHFSYKACKKHYFAMLEEEKNPMLKQPLTKLHEEEQKQQVNWIKEMIKQQLKEFEKKQGQK